MKGDIELHFVHTQGQLPDIFTKALDESAFVNILHGLGMMEMAAEDRLPRMIEESNMEEEPEDSPSEAEKASHPT